MKKIKAEYIWTDGNDNLRSKTKVINTGEDVPVWGFDGGSTYQSINENSDLVLHPVRVYKDPFSKKEDVLVLCTVNTPTGEAHPTNSRAELEKLNVEDMWFGFEQEYTLFSETGDPLAWELGTPQPQGDYYCGVGHNRVCGREVSVDHLDKCIEAGVDIFGSNAEVMPGQWEFQTSPNNSLKASDDLLISRYILERVGESCGVTVSYHPKPVSGEWNGAGCHTNFSTKEMRGGWGGIVRAIDRLSIWHNEHMEVYGDFNDLRMTGACETSDYNRFTYGERDRSCSIRIPWKVALDKKGYLEDRRPAANINPYKVCARLIKTVCHNKK